MVSNFVIDYFACPNFQQRGHRILLSRGKSSGSGLMLEKNRKLRNTRKKDKTPLGKENSSFRTAKPFVRPDYHEYILSKKWRKKRKKALIRAGNKCETCTSSFHLFVHHLTYERLGREIPRDLQVLCKNCYLMAHEDKPGIPRDSLTEEYHAIMGVRSHGQTNMSSVRKMDFGRR